MNKSTVWLNKLSVNSSTEGHGCLKHTCTDSKGGTNPSVGIIIMSSTMQNIRFSSVTHGKQSGEQ